MAYGSIIAAVCVIFCNALLLQGANGSEWIKAGSDTPKNKISGPVFHMQHHYKGVVTSHIGPLPLAYYVHLGSRDAARHKLRLNLGSKSKLTVVAKAAKTDSSSVQDLFGSVYPNGLYTMDVKIGSQQQPFKLMVDTGSDFVWLPCSTCTGAQCLAHKGDRPPLKIKQSSSSSVLPCSSSACRNSNRIAEGGPETSSCRKGATGCHYSYQYADGSNTTGVVILDVLRLSGTGTLSVSMPLGCSFAPAGKAFDGIAGMGPGRFGLPYQMHFKYGKLGVKNLFTVCLGGAQGGGSLAFGDALIPATGVQYTYIPSNGYRIKALWTVYWNKLSVGTDTVKQLTDKLYYGMAADTGTTYTILPDDLVESVMGKVLNIVPLEPVAGLDGAHITASGLVLLCYETRNGLSKEKIQGMFPPITFNFLGNSTMTIKPSTYLIYPMLDSGNVAVCLSIMATQKKFIPILGESWMRDFLTIYDLENHRFGWVPTDCSSLQ